MLIAAVTLALVLALGFFGLNYARLLGSNQEQRTCIQSAAMAAANDLSRIVITDPNFGVIGISDCAPISSQINANDGYYAPVLSINTLLATVRLDMIIANSLGQPIMIQLANDDYANAMTAKTNLVTDLQTAIISGGVDINNNPVNPLNDAITAYNQNSIRMTGNATQLVPNSMVLTLGCVANLPTDTPTPTPAASSNVTAAQTSTVNGKSCYKAFVDVPYNGFDFVFAGTTDSIKIVDQTQFQTTVAGCPYVIPTIVKADADQNFQPAAHNGQTGVQTIHASAAAEPMNILDPRPCPGGLCVSFPDKLPANVKSIAAILAMPSQLTSFFSNGGDFPPSPPYSAAAPNSGNLVASAARDVGATGSIGQFTQLALYDWLRRNGTRPDIAAVTDMVSFSFVPFVGGTGEKYIFEIDPAGTGAIQFYANYCNPTPFLSVGNDQMIAQPAFDNPAALAALGPALEPTNPPSWTDGADGYDVYVRDEAYKPGTADLFHIGEPMYDNLLFQASSGKWNTQLITRLIQPDNTICLSTGEHGAGGMGANGGGGGGGGGATACDTSVTLGTTGTVSTRDDFGFAYTPVAPETPPAYIVYPNYPLDSLPPPANPHARPTYQQNGVAVDIRFRRNLPPTGANPGQMGHCIH